MEDLAKITDEQILSRFNTTEDPTVFAEIYIIFITGNCILRAIKGAHLLT